MRINANEKMVEQYLLSFERKKWKILPPYILYEIKIFFKNIHEIRLFQTLKTEIINHRGICTSEKIKGNFLGIKKYTRCKFRLTQGTKRKRNCIYVSK